MSLIDKLKSEYPDIVDWAIEQGDTKEKERINQNIEITEFVATSSDKSKQRRFTYTHFTDYRGTKESWREG